MQMVLFEPALPSDSVTVYVMTKAVTMDVSVSIRQLPLSGVRWLANAIVWRQKKSASLHDRHWRPISLPI